MVGTAKKQSLVKKPAAKKTTPANAKAPPPKTSAKAEPSAKAVDAPKGTSNDKPKGIPVTKPNSDVMADAARIQARAAVNEAAQARALNTSAGEHYEGATDSEGRRDGQGTLTWANGNQYKGQWVAGRMTGHAIFTYGGQGGDVYEGMFLNDKKHGQGQYVFANGNTYVGHFENDKRHGFGEYRWVCGDMYIGEWFEGKMHGKGVTTYANGNQYEGHFKEDRRDGHGKLVCVDGLTFEGEWKNNMRNGQGTLTFPNGDQYEGGWWDDQKHGKGIDSFVNGNRFEGIYDHNQKSGTGIMTFANGDVYDGDWFQDTMHGKGTYKFNNGYVYEGSWQHDLRHGYGVYRYNNIVYEGQWLEDKRSGQGVMTIDDGGEVYKGEWKGGKMEGRFEVTITKPVQAKYIGEWKAGQPLGTGTFTFESGAQFTGQWDERKQKSKIKNEVLNMICEVPDEPEDPKATVSKFADSADERRWNDQCLYVECLQRDQATLIQQLATMQEDKDEALRQREQNMELQRALKASQLELELALDKNGQVTTTLSTLQEQLQRQSEDAEKMQQLLTTAQEQTQAFKADCEQRDKKLLEAQEEMEKVRSSQSQEASAEAEKLRTQCADLEKQCAALKDQLAQAQEQAQAQAKAKAEAVSTEDANSWKAQLLAASDQLLASQKQVQELQSQLVAKQAELDELKAGAMAAKDAEVHVQNDKAIQEAEIQAKTALASKDAELDAKMAELEAKNVELQTQAHTLKEQQGTIQELQRQLADATAKVEGSAGNAEDLRARDHKISQLELQINVLKMENADTSKEMLLAREWAQKMKDDAVAAHEKCQFLEAGTAQQKDWIAQLEQHMAALTAERDQLKEQRPPTPVKAPDGPSPKELQLMKQVADLKNALEEAEEENRRQEADKAPQMAVLMGLREAKSDAEADLRVAKQELSSVTEQLSQEKKRRKRAEKLLNNGGDLSAEAYKNQLLIVKAELEKKTQEVASLNSRIDTREQRAHYESNFGRDSVGSPLSNDSRVGALEQKIRELLQKMEEKDQLLQYQAQEIRKVTQLQAQLQVAHDKLEVMNHSTEISSMKEMTRLLSAHSQMENRYLLSLEPEQRKAELSKEVFRRANSEGRLAGPLPGAPKPTPPSNPRALGHSQSMKPSSRGSRKPDLDL